MSTPNQHLWGIILAGGEGTRLQEFVRTRYHSDCPKQYCTFVGTRSMLQHTIDRAERLIPPERLLTIISKQHLEYAQRLLSDRPFGTVIIQPCLRETAPGILYPLLHILDRQPDALVAIFPSDHFVLQEERFMDYVSSAAAFIGRFPHAMVLLGVEPDRPEKDYGWIHIEPSMGAEDWGGIYPIRSFIEKPDSLALRSSGKHLWNTMVLVCRAEILLRQFRVLTPTVYDAFQGIHDVLGSPGEKEAVEKMFARLAPVNFSHAVLAKNPGGLRVLRMDDLYWSDWGNPERIESDLKRIADVGISERAFSACEGVGVVV